MRRIGVVAVALGLGASVFIVACQPTSSPIDIYSYAGRCEVLKDATTGRYVARDVIGYTANASQGAATRYRLQATAHGRYLHLVTEVLGSRVFFEVVQRLDGYDGYGTLDAPVRMAAHRRLRAKPPA